MTIDETVNQEVSSDYRAIAADTVGKVTYSLAVGIPLDYFASGLRGMGIVASRASATAMNTVTGRPYGIWREGWYSLTNTTNESSKVRKWLCEMGAFNTFETYVYGAGVCVASIVEKGEIDYWNVQSGMEALIKISPFIAPTMGWWMNAVRKMFGVSKVGEN